MRACAFSLVIRRSVSVTPVSASPRVSPQISRILAPPSDLMPPAWFTSSTAMVSAFRWLAPNLALGPVSGDSTPMRISSCAAAPPASPSASAIAPSAAPPRFAHVLACIGPSSRGLAAPVVRPTRPGRAPP